MLIVAIITSFFFLVFLLLLFFFFFFFNDTATTEIYTLSLHDALPIYRGGHGFVSVQLTLQECEIGMHLHDEFDHRSSQAPRSEEHTSELQSPCNLVCRLLLEKKKKTTIPHEILHLG